MPRYNTKPHEFDTLFRAIYSGLGISDAPNEHHYQRLTIIDRHYIFVSFVPSRYQPDKPLPFRLEWRLQTGGVEALRRIKAGHGERIETVMGQSLDWDENPGPFVAFLNLWYTGPDSDTARIAWVLETAPRFIQSLRDAVK